jgi:choline-sulfatase
MFTRRDFIKASGAAGLSLAAWPLKTAASDGGAGGPRRPNILVVLTDDHGQWAQHAYGNSELLTPHMNGLAATGVRMTNAFTPCPVCSPARASFFTGRMPSQHGIHDYLSPQFDLTHPGLAGQTLISELLKGGGYHTGLVGKWHCARNRGPQRGFDRWFSHYTSDQQPHVGTQHFSDQGRLVVEEGQQSRFFTERAVDFLRDHHANAVTRRQPFFLFVSYVDTHTPHDSAPADLVAQYRSATFRDIPRERFAGCHGYAIHGVNPDPDVERQRQADYYGAVSSVDRELGKLVAELEATGQRSDTVIVYTGDHGLNCGHHGVWEKGNTTIPQNFLEESIRVACTVSWPNGGVLPNATCGDLVNHCDLWATLLDAAGVVLPEPRRASINSPGRSYLAQLRGAAIPDWRDAIICEYGNARMVRTDRYKLIKRYPFESVRYPDELYDLRDDARETINRYGDGSLPGVEHELALAVDRFFASYSVPGNSGLRLEQQSRCSNDSPWLNHVPKA